LRALAWLRRFASEVSMIRPALYALLAASAALPLSPSAAPRAAGRIESDEARIEILGRPLRVGERIELPEGFLRVEESGPEDDQVGSFAVVPVESFGSFDPAAAVAAAGDPAPASATAPSCRAERAAYLAELWKANGIEVSDPVALLEGLEGGATGPATGFYWFAIATDAFRQLAWSSELRSRANALARCVRGG
jgi:hypothetical protein